MNSSKQIYPPQEPKEIPAQIKVKEDQSGNMVMSLSHTTNEQKINRLHQESAILFRTKSVFPFDLFPNEVIIRENKVDVVVNFFFFSSYTIPMIIKDLINSTISTGPFFAAISFELRGFESNPPIIRYLPKGEAIYAHRLIYGLIALHKSNINLSQMSPRQVKKQAEEVGATPVS